MNSFAAGFITVFIILFFLLRFARDTKDRELPFSSWLKKNLLFLIIGSIIGTVILSALGPIYSGDNCNASVDICE